MDVEQDATREVESFIELADMPEANKRSARAALARLAEQQDAGRDEALADLLAGVELALAHLRVDDSRRTERERMESAARALEAGIALCARPLEEPRT